MILPDNFKNLDINKLKRENEKLGLITEEDYCDYAYDFNTGQLKLRNGKNYYVYGNEALKIWVYKMVTTERFKNPAYSSRFGNEIYTLVGEIISDRFKKEEIKRYLIEGLMVHPYIKSINDIKIKTDKSLLIVNVYFTSIFKNEVVRVKCDIPIY